MSRGIVLIDHNDKLVEMRADAYDSEDLLQRLLARIRRSCGKPPFDNESNRLEFLHRLNRIRSIDIPSDAVTRRPSIRIVTLGTGKRLDALLSVVGWYFNTIRETKS